MWPQVLFGVGLIGLSIGLLRIHRLQRDTHKSQTNDKKSDRTEASRYHYRMLSSALIGVAGIMLIGGLFVHGPVPMAIYWTLVICVAIAIVFLGLLDLARARSYLNQLQAEHLAERTALEAEIRAHLRRHQEGAPPNAEPTDGAA